MAAEQSGPPKKEPVKKSAADRTLEIPVPTILPRVGDVLEHPGIPPALVMSLMVSKSSKLQVGTWAEKTGMEESWWSSFRNWKGNPHTFRFFTFEQAAAAKQLFAHQGKPAQTPRAGETYLNRSLDLLCVIDETNMKSDGVILVSYKIDPDDIAQWERRNKVKIDAKVLEPKPLFTFNKLWRK